MVGGHGEAGVGMTEAFAHDLDRNTGGDEQAGVGVAKVVESDPGETGAGEVPVEQLADRLGVHRPACGVREHRVGEPDGRPSCAWRRAPGGEDRLGGRVEVDASSAGASLDRDFDRAAGDALAAAATESRCPAWSQSPHRSPASSPRRIPVMAARCNAG